MPVKAKDLIAYIEELAPSRLAEAWDNSGWQVGNPNAEIEKAMVALDVDERVVAEAADTGCQLIICHHPLLMQGLKSVRLDTTTGRLLGSLLQKGIGVYAAHTNLDCAEGGINDLLAERLGLREAGVLKPVRKEKLYKLVVFVPSSHVEPVAAALSRAGAGRIGEYLDCTFRVEGTGTFRPGEGTNPYVGKQGVLEKVREIRLETVLPEGYTRQAIKALQEAHPYEEVAYDIYPLVLEGPASGLGRVGRLQGTLKFYQFIEQVKAALGVGWIRYGGDRESDVDCVAVCGGSGADLWPAAKAAGAQVLVTGDIKYHTARDILAAGMKFIDAGHFATERIIVRFLRDYLTDRVQKKEMDVIIVESSREEDPFQTA